MQALTALLFHALARLAESADDATAAATLGQPSDYSLLLDLLTAPAVLEQVRKEDSLGPARLRWLCDRERLLAAEGGAVTVSAVMELLGLKSRQAVQQRWACSTLLGLPLGRSTYLYPAWQFAGQAVLLGLPETLAALAPLDPLGPGCLPAGRGTAAGWRAPP